MSAHSMFSKVQSRPAGTKKVSYGTIAGGITYRVATVYDKSANRAVYHVDFVRYDNNGKVIPLNISRKFNSRQDASDWISHVRAMRL